MVYIEPDEIWIVVVAFIVAFILSIGIGANDVANNFGTSVGSKVLTIRQACIIASIVEIAGAVLVGSKVTDTIRKGAINIEVYANETELLMVGQLSALTGSCIWLIIATILKMPVSGTHSVVFATVGYTLVAKGWSGVNGKKLLGIIIGLLFSPMISGIVSVILFFIIKIFILDKRDTLEPGLRFLPLFYSFSIWLNIFITFYKGPELLGFSRIPLWGALVMSCGAGIVTAILIQLVFVPWQRGKIKTKVKNQREQMAINALEESNREIDVSDYESHLGDHSKLEPIVEEEKVRSKDITVKVYSENPPLYHTNQEHKKLTVTIAFDNDAYAKNSSDDVFNDSTRSYSGRDAISRSRSKSLVYGRTSAVPHEPSETKRVRSKSESTSDSLKENQQEVRPRVSSESRSRTYSDSIDNLRNRRFQPVDKTLALSAELKFAQEEERRLEEQGLSPEEIEKKTRATIEDKPEQAQLFAYLQILTAVFQGFAHGGNDVSNAIGPLVGIWTSATSATEEIAAKTEPKLWLLMFGGIGMTVGLWVWGRRVIETMGENLAKITPSTGFCIEFGAATTVLVFTYFKFPISTTHCKVGSVAAVSRARSKNNVDWKLFGSILLTWVITLPATLGIGALVMLILKQFV